MTYSNEICVERYPDDLYCCSRQQAMDEQIEQSKRLWTHIDKGISWGYIWRSIVHIKENLGINRAKLAKMRSYNPGRLPRDLLEVEMYGRSRFQKHPEERFLKSMRSLEDIILKLKEKLPDQSLLQEKRVENIPRHDFQSVQHRQENPCYYAVLLVVAAIAVCAFRIL